MITASAVLLFLGAMGKSAQFPLHVWLPDAMEGPTPVSALIHAATMVVAGVFLVARMLPLFELSSTAMTLVAVIGIITALMAGSMALVMTDLKRILAYSTVSHLGFMMLALGAGGFTAALFHMLAHAFAKAMLFLSAGSVSHAIDKLDIREMGGLAGRMPATAFCFTVGALALGGLPPLSGFFSKDELLLAVQGGLNPIFLVLALVAAFLSALYMARPCSPSSSGSSRLPTPAPTSPPSSCWRPCWSWRSSRCSWEDLPSGWENSSTCTSPNPSTSTPPLRPSP